MKKIICSICSKEFDSKRTDAKTCSPACRKKLHSLTPEKKSEKEIEVIKEVAKNIDLHPSMDVFGNQMKKNHTRKDCRPNWQRNGFKNRVEAVQHIVKMILDRGSRINSQGLGDKATLVIGDVVIEL